MTAKTIVAALLASFWTLPALGMTPTGNVGNKGSLLIFPRVDVRDGNDTLITLTNDSALPVRLKCFYATSDTLGTPYAGSAESARPLKRYADFTIDLTHNQPVSWWASSGYAVLPSTRMIAPPFSYWASDGTSTSKAGELKCWAVTDDITAERHFNHLFGSASIFVTASGQAVQYGATAFQAIGPATLTGTALDSPGVLNLDNREYDGCPNILVGNFVPGGRGADGPQNLITLASCNQDLRQAYTPTITKLTWTFWNQDEQQRTGTHACADSWFETDFPASMLNAQFLMLGTDAAYFRIETTGDTQICGPSATTSAYTGVMVRSVGAGQFRGTHLTGRGVAAPAAIRWDPSSPDGYRQ